MSFATAAVRAYPSREWRTSRGSVDRRRIDPKTAASSGGGHGWAVPAGRPRRASPPSSPRVSTVCSPLARCPSLEGWGEAGLSPRPTCRWDLFDLNPARDGAGTGTLCRRKLPRRLSCASALGQDHRRRRRTTPSPSEPRAPSALGSQVTHPPVRVDSGPGRHWYEGFATCAQLPTRVRALRFAR